MQLKRVMKLLIHHGVTLLQTCAKDMFYVVGVGVTGEMRQTSLKLLGLKGFDHLSLFSVNLTYFVNI